MYDKKLYQKVCDVTCTDQELTALSVDLSTTKVDADHLFQKYYSLATITKAINKYLNGEISDKYLADWMNAYNWIISSGNDYEKDNDKYTLEEYVQYEISNTLDILSFFNEDDFKDINYEVPEFCKTAQAYLKNCLGRFQYYDLIYQNLNNLVVYYQIIHEKKHDDELEFLCVNEKEKTYLFFDVNIYSAGDQIDGQQLTEAKFNTQIQTLKAAGYTVIAQSYEEY